MRSRWAAVLFSISPLFAQSYPVTKNVFSNIFGGRSGSDAATSLAVDPGGNVAVIGTTGSPDFPVTNAYLPNIPLPPLIVVSQNGWTFPNLGAAVDVTAMASTKDGSVVYAASDSGIFRSADAGATWSQQHPGLAGANSLAVDGANPNTVYAVISGDLNNASSGIFKSIDGGQTWTAITALQYLPFSFIATLECPAQLAGTIYATDNGFYRSRDAGATWTAIGPNNNNVFSFALAASDPNVVYAISSNGLVYRSADGGDHWTASGGTFAAYPSANGDLYAMAMAVDPQDENTVWALELNGSLFKSTDGGATFSVVLSDPAEQAAVFLSVSPSGQNIVVGSRGQSGGGGNAIVSYDGGGSWNRVIAADIVNGVLAGQSVFFIEADAYTQGFLTKWSADGSHMIFSTFLAGEPTAVASDGAGNTYVGGQTLTKFDTSGNELFSQSLGALSVTAMTVDSEGGVYLAASNTNSVSGPCGTVPTIMKFDPQGNPLFSQAFPQTCGLVYSMALDTSGAIYLAGYTFSKSLVTTATAIEPAASANPEANNGFLAVLSPQADQLTYLSYLQGAFGVAVDPAGNVYVAGGANSPAPFAPTSTFTGATCGSASAGFGFVVKLSLSLPAPLWFAEIGGGCAQGTNATRVAIDEEGDVWVGGSTSSGLFPTLAPFEVEGTDQGFVAELSADGTNLLRSSYAPAQFVLGPGQTVYTAGAAAPNSPKVDTQNFSGYLTSAIVQKIDVSQTGSAAIDSINAIQPLPDYRTLLLGIAPGEMVRIAGRGLGPTATLTAQLDSAGRLATTLGGVQVLFNGVPAPLIGVQASGIVCMTPFEVSGTASAGVQVVESGAATPAVVVGVKQVAYTASVLSVANRNGTLNSPSNPAHPGDVVTIYGTGFGGTNPMVPDGSLYQTPLPVPLYSITTPVYAASTQSVAYAGPAPGLVAGIWQVNVELGPGAASNANPLQVYLNSTYMNGTYIPQETIVPVWVAPL